MSISPPVRIGSNSAASGTSLTITLGTVVPVGALVGVWTAWTAGSGQLISVADSASNPYTIAITAATPPMVSVAYSANIGVQLNIGSTITVTYGSSQTNMHASAFSLAGAGGVGVVDLMQGISGATSQFTNVLTANNALIDMTEIVCVFLGVSETGLSGTSVTGNLPYVLGIAQDSSIPNMELWYSIVSTAAGQPAPTPTASASWTSAAANWGLTMVSFQEAEFIQTPLNTPSGTSGG